MKRTALTLAAAATALLAVSASTPVPAEAKAMDLWVLCAYGKLVSAQKADTPQQIPELIRFCFANGGDFLGVQPVRPPSKD